MNFVVKKFERKWYGDNYRDHWKPLGVCDILFGDNITTISHVDHMFNHNLDTFDISITTEYIEILSTLRVEKGKSELFNIRCTPWVK